MDTLVRLNADELNVALIDFIKSSFRGKKIAVHIYEDEIDETEFVLRDPVARERILKAVENVNQNKNIKEYTMDEINSFLNESEL
ncbi:MAG TPA: hypothetical protein VH396_14915 [Chitinophagaceae bacterium]|jgi:hypothetical protein